MSAVLVHLLDDPALVLDCAGQFLEREPLKHHHVLSLLHDEAASCDTGRYWLVMADDCILGIVCQQSTGSPALITPMPIAAVSVAAAAIASGGVTLPGVEGDAATAVAFAGAWSEVSRSGATPFNEQRLYELQALEAPTDVRGQLRQATNRDRALLIEWVSDLGVEVADEGYYSHDFVKRRLEAGQLWLWDNHGPVSLAGHSAPLHGVSRIGAVYTPVPHRRHGYGGACVAALSRRLLDEGHRCVLYANLSNPASNSVYRRIGYRPVAEILRYRFG